MIFLNFDVMCFLLFWEIFVTPLQSLKNCLCIAGCDNRCIPGRVAECTRSENIMATQEQQMIV